MSVIRHILRKIEASVLGKQPWELMVNTELKGKVCVCEDLIEQLFVYSV